MMSRRRFVALLPLLLATTAGCRRPRDPLRIGFCLWPGYEYLHLAARLGYLSEAGLPPQLIEFATVGDVRLAYERGDVQGVTCTLAEVVLAAPRAAHPLQVVAVTDYSSGADVLLARAAITDLASLRGRRIGVEPGTLGIQLLNRALNEAGLALDDIELVTGDLTALDRACRDGRLDALVTYQPFAARLTSEGLAHVVYDSSRTPGEILDVLAFGADTVRNRPADVASVVKAFFKAQNHAVRSPETALPTMAARARITPEALRHSLDNELKIMRAGDQRRLLSERAIEPKLDEVSRLFSHLGLIERPIAASTHYTDRFVSAAEASS